ncbi:DUF2975 domain-containing protein [Streptomyces sioyaensis]|uniref:DUF2975 domain-containing protein n=1 Tax=Streptomyces sioyaensis TaxID=67364 RepID=UPI0036A0256A
MNDAPRWSRINNRVLEVLLGLGLVVALFSLGPPAQSILDHPAPRDVLLTDAATPDDLRLRGITLYRQGIAQMDFTHPHFTQRLLLVLPQIVTAVLIIMILWCLLRLTQTFRQGDYFAPENTRRLAVVAVAILLSGLLVPALDTITTQLLVNGTPAEPAVEVQYQFNAPLVYLGLLIAAAAQAFRNGTRLKADSEGLV